MIPLARLLTLALALILSACAFLPGAYDYEYHEVGRFMYTREGVVVSYQQVNISGDSHGVGTATGAIAGASIAGSGRDGWTGLWGAIIGGLIGGAIEAGINSRIGYAYTIRLDNGHIASIVQADYNPIPAGTPVLLQTDSRRRGRIIPNPSPSASFYPPDTANTSQPPANKSESPPSSPPASPEPENNADTPL